MLALSTGDLEMEVRPESAEDLLSSGAALKAAAVVGH